MMETEEEDQLGRWCETWRSVTKSRGAQECPTNNKQKEG